MKLAPFAHLQHKRDNHKAHDNRKADGPQQKVANQPTPAADPERPDYSELLKASEEIRRGMADYLSQLLYRVPQAFVLQPLPSYQPTPVCSRGWGGWGALLANR